MYKKAKYEGIKKVYINAIIHTTNCVESRKFAKAVNRFG